jgi:hypothetical protein
MWIWWLLCGERPLPGIRGALVGQPVRLRSRSPIAIVTRIAPDGVTWGRYNGLHESNVAACEMAAGALASRPQFSRDDEERLIAQLMRQFNLSADSASTIVASEWRKHQRQ